MASLNPWRRLREAWRYHLQTQRDIVESSRVAQSMQQATLEELRSTLRVQQTGLEELRSATGATEQRMQVLLRQQYRDLAVRGGPLPDFADVEFRCNSQNGEDGILLYIFSLIGTTNRKALEICAGDGIECNTANLILNHGFRGLLFDGGTEAIERGRAFYATHPNTCIRPPHLAAVWITAETVNDQVAAHGFAGDIDLLSLDLDGNDYWVWQALTVVRPRVVVLEFNSGCGPEVAATMSYKPDFRMDATVTFSHYGASLSAFVKLGRAKGYRMIGVQLLGFNAFFVRDDVGADLLPEVTAAQMYARYDARYGPIDWGKSSDSVMNGPEPWERI
jgi:hypothetical protein